MAALNLTPITEGRRHYAPAVAAVHRALWGADPMPHQAHLQRLATEQLEDDSWAYQTLVMTIPRQGGKTSGLGPLLLHRCMTRPLARVQFTAQTRQDARDIVIDEWAARFKRTPFARLAKVRASQGSEGVYFTGSTDASLRVFPPEAGGLDGKANEIVAADETWKITPATGLALDNSIMPTFTTTGGQFLMVSTAGTAQSTWLLDTITQGRDAVAAGMRTGVALLEYGLPAELVPRVRDLLSGGAFGPGIAEAVQLLAEHNPAYGYTLRLDALTNGVRKMLADPTDGVDGVLRAYGNVWARTVQVLIPLHLFDDAPPAAPSPGERAALGVAVGIDRDDVALVAAWRDHTGRPHLRVQHHAPTLQGAAAALADQTRARPWAGIGCVAAGPVLELVDAAEQRHRAHRVTRLPSGDYSTATAQALAMLADQVAAHDHHAALRSAVENAALRRLGDGARAWSRQGSAGSIAALEAATVALWVLDHAPSWELPQVK